MKVYFSILSSLLIVFSIHAQTLNSIESVEYDASQNRFLISNGSSILQRASNGTLSFFGEAEGAAADYGMEVMNGHLFAIQGDKIVAYDLETEAEVMRLTISGAGFLNGLTNDGAGRLWATDFGARRIYEIDASDLDNPSFEMVASNLPITPNGIVYEESTNRLLVVSWGNNATIRAVDLTDYSLTTVITTGLGNIDGIDEDNNGDYYISHWTPAGITKYPSDFSMPTTISVPGINRPADICYAKAIDTLAIPSNGNALLFVGFEPTSVETALVDAYSLSLAPNPMQSESILAFYLPTKERIQLNIYDTQGKFVRSLMNRSMLAGWHKVVLLRRDLMVGNYLVQLKTKATQQTTRLQVVD